MPVSTVEYNALLSRISVLENTCKILYDTLIRFVTVEQAEQLGLLGQQDVEALKTRVTGLEARVATLENHHKI